MAVDRAVRRSEQAVEHQARANVDVGRYRDSTVRTFTGDHMSPHAKSLALGLAVVGLLGVDILQSSITALGDDIPTP